MKPLFKVGQKVNFTESSIKCTKDLINNPISVEAYGLAYLQERLGMEQTTQTVEALVPFTNMQTKVKSIRVKLVGKKVPVTQENLIANSK